MENQNEIYIGTLQLLDRLIETVEITHDLLYKLVWRQKIQDDYGFHSNYAVELLI